MTDIKQISGGICAAEGFRAAGIYCGIRKKKDKKDLALIFSSVPASAAAVYTTNLVKGAPLTVTKQNISDGIAQAVICDPPYKIDYCIMHLIVHLPCPFLSYRYYAYPQIEGWVIFLCSLVFPRQRRRNESSHRFQ